MLLSIKYRLDLHESRLGLYITWLICEGLDFGLNDQMVWVSDETFLDSRSSLE